MSPQVRDIPLAAVLDAGVQGECRVPVTQHNASHRLVRRGKPLSAQGQRQRIRHLRYVAKDGSVVMSGRSIYRGDVVRYGFSVPL